MVYMLAEMFTCFDEAYLGETLEAFGHDFGMCGPDQRDIVGGWHKPTRL